MKYKLFLIPALAAAISCTGSDEPPENAYLERPPALQKEEKPGDSKARAFYNWTFIPSPEPGVPSKYRVFTPDGPVVMTEKEWDKCRGEWRKCTQEEYFANTVFPTELSVQFDLGGSHPMKTCLDFAVKREYYPHRKKNMCGKFLGAAITLYDGDSYEKYKLSMGGELKAVQFGQAPILPEDLEQLRSGETAFARRRIIDGSVTQFISGERGMTRKIGGGLEFGGQDMSKFKEGLEGLRKILDEEIKKKYPNKKGLKFPYTGIWDDDDWSMF